MASCLGIYLEKNLIKYAKVSKNRDDFKIESFGVRIFENSVDEINNIIEETYSFGEPISINLSSEQYMYFDIFSLLSRKDIEKSVEIEFENNCEEKRYNKNALENRYAMVQNLSDANKLKTINVVINKIELNKEIQRFEKHNLTNIAPLPMIISNLNKLGKNENAIIVNMEEKTTITTIIDNQIYHIETLKIGSKKIIDEINKIETSYAKSYEILKNTTIYTADDSGSAEQPYIQFIIPVLMDINRKIQEILLEYKGKIATVYLTGTLANINNIDLYFQEFLGKTNCKILKPTFLNNTNKQVNIKDYIEVNSAISLALSGLGEGVKGMNFKKNTLLDKIAKNLTVKPKKKKLPLKSENINNENEEDANNENTDNKNEENIINNEDTNDENNKKVNKERNKPTKLDKTELWLARGITGFALLLIIFLGFSIVLTKQMNSKEKQIEDLLSKQSEQISRIDSDNQSLTSKTQKYKTLISELDTINEKISDINSSKNLIPNLLNQIMFIIPEEVQLTSISNTSGKQIEINAQSSKYEQLGYFIAKIKEKGYLNNVVSSSGVKSGGTVTVNIKGELP